MTEFSDLSDEALGRRLAGLPRHAAPARLRATILRAAAPPPRRAAWWSPALAAMAAALVLGLFFVPLLPRVPTLDPTDRLVRAVVAEHTRAVLWGARRDAIVPTALPWLAQETGIGLVSVFLGDDRLQLLGAEPVYLDQRRGLAVHYRDADGHHVTYVVLPVPTLTVPERERIKVDRFRPALVHDYGYSVWLWKQGDLACFMVADMVAQDDLARFKDYFVRVRQATEPVRAY
jgi:hypothetical protein